MLTNEEKKIVTKAIAQYCRIKNELTEPSEAVLIELDGIVNSLNEVCDTQEKRMEVISMIAKADIFLHEEGIL